MNQLHIYQITSDDLLGAIERASENNHKKIIEESFLNRFENCTVSASTVCDIWDINSATLSSYIKAGIITPINPGSSKHLFNLKDILAIDNPKYRRLKNVG